MLDAEGNNLARLNAHHPRIVRHAGELLANLGQNEQPELFAAAKSYFDNVNRDLNQIDFERLWGEGVYLEEAEAAAARRIKDAMREPLNDAALAALKALLQIHGPFILATKAGLENLAFANAYEMRPEEAKEQRAAAIELAQEFKANPDVVAPETSADFAHFAEQPELTAHPERSAAFTIGMVQNIAIVTTAGAAIGAIIAGVGLETGNVVSGVTALPLRRDDARDARCRGPRAGRHKSALRRCEAMAIRSAPWLFRAEAHQHAARLALRSRTSSATPAKQGGIGRQFHFSDRLKKPRKGCASRVEKLRYRECLDRFPIACRTASAPLRMSKAEDLANRAVDHGKLKVGII